MLTVNAGCEIDCRTDVASYVHCKIAHQTKTFLLGASPEVLFQRSTSRTTSVRLSPKLTAARYSENS